MSRQAEARTAQVYDPKPRHPMCMNCRFFTKDSKVETGYFGDYTRETNLRCSKGNFAVKKTANCQDHKFA